MKEYNVEITETLQKTITIMAESEEDAIEKVKEEYYAEEIVLDDSAYIDTEYKIVESEED